MIWMLNWNWKGKVKGQQIEFDWNESDHFGRIFGQNETDQDSLELMRWCWNVDKQRDRSKREKMISIRVGQGWSRLANLDFILIKFTLTQKQKAKK